MTIADKLVLQRQHHLKWRSFDRLELILMIVCGVLCFGFSLSVMCDIVTRTIGHPWLWLQEVTSTLFIYAIFIGAAVATRRNDHLYLTAVGDVRHRHADHRPSLAVVAGSHLDAVHLRNLHRCGGRHPAQRPSLSDSCR